MEDKRNNHKCETAATAVSPDNAMFPPWIQQRISHEETYKPRTVHKKKNNKNNFRPKKRASRGAIMSCSDTSILKFPSLTGPDASPVKRPRPRWEQELSGDLSTIIQVPSPSPPLPPPLMPTSFLPILPIQLEDSNNEDSTSNISSAIAPLSLRPRFSGDRALGADEESRYSPTILFPSLNQRI